MNADRAHYYSVSQTLPHHHSLCVFFTFFLFLSPFSLLAFLLSHSLTTLSILFPFRAAETWRLLSDHGAPQPALRHTLWPAPALCGADWPGVRERLRGAGYAGWQGTCHWGRYAHISFCLHTRTQQWHLTSIHSSDLRLTPSMDPWEVLGVRLVLSWWQSQWDLTCSH